MEANVMVGFSRQILVISSVNSLKQRLKVPIKWFYIFLIKFLFDRIIKTFLFSSNSETI